MCLVPATTVYSRYRKVRLLQYTVQYNITLQVISFLILLIRFRQIVNQAGPTGVTEFEMGTAVAHKAAGSIRVTEVDLLVVPLTVDSIAGCFVTQTSI